MENTKTPTFGNGKICYLEIPADDIDASVRFYQTVFGWKIRTRNDGTIAFDDGVGEVSGTWIVGREPSVEPGLLISIMVDDVAETVEQLKASGSTIINEMQIGPSQFIAHFTDPAGNVLGIYQHPGGGHGKICYVEIPAGDIRQSATFYHTVFGWPVRGEEYDLAFEDGVGVVSGMWVKDRQPSATVGLLIYVMIDDIYSTVNTIINQGGKIVQHIGADEPELTARFSDPDGNVLGVFQQS